MEWIRKFDYYADPDRAEVWWEKPEGADACTRYQVFLDGAIAGETDRTHFTVENLEADREYMIQVAVLTVDQQTSAIQSGGQNPSDGSMIAYLAHPGSIHMEEHHSAGGAAAVAAVPAGALSQDDVSVTFQTPMPRKRIDVTASPYFAKGDGQTMNTAILQKAFDDCPADGSVYFPAGTYLTGALRLHSDMELYLDEGAVLQGSADPADYLPRIRSRFEGTEMECYQSLLNLGDLDHTSGPNCTNVIIRGKGAIKGGGFALAWATIQSEKERLKDYLAANADYVATCENDNTIPGRVRGRLINMSNCSHIRISGLTLADGASWNLHMVYSDHIITDHCLFSSKGTWNGDGWDPDSSEDCTLFACTFHTEDDSVAIKSGKNPEGNEINRPARHIRIFDCRSAFGHGLCIGSEMSGGIEDVKIWDCDLEHSMVGIQVKGTPKRGGFVRGLHVQDCTVPCLQAVSVGYNDDGVPAPEPPHFENFSYERVTVTGRSLLEEWTDCKAIEFKGFDETHPIRNILFKNVKITGGLGVTVELCEDVRFEE
ncbi:MAG: glycosyl hydrolase family 28 protein [Lachnospiraceae bacterium]|nr:glycosyl hydrolase family 28 protein [Lachnospiraceae bacterium]